MYAELSTADLIARADKWLATCPKSLKRESVRSLRDDAVIPQGRRSATTYVPTGEIRHAKLTLTITGEWLERNRERKPKELIDLVTALRDRVATLIERAS